MQELESLNIVLQHAVYYRAPQWGGRRQASDVFWRFVQQFVGGVNQLSLKLFGWLVSDGPAGEKQDAEVLGWCGHMWSVAVGGWIYNISKFQEKTLDVVYWSVWNIQFLSNFSGDHSCSQRVVVWHCVVR